jgi:predicted PurR-regulated permease PerM
VSPQNSSQGMLSDHALRSWIFAGVVLWVLVGAGLVVRGMSEVLGVLMVSLGPFMVAGLLVMLVRPITRGLKARGMNDGFAALIGTIVAILGIIVLTAVFAGPVIGGAVGFFTALPETISRLVTQAQSALDAYSRLNPTMRGQIESVLQSVGGSLAALAGNALGLLVNGLSSVLTAGLSLFMGLILTFWFLKDGPRITHAILEIVPDSLHDDVCLVGSSFDSSFSGYLVATSINVLVIFVLDGVAFSIIHLPNGWFVAAMIGLVGVIPFVGSILSAVIAVVVGLTVGVQIGIITGVIVFVVDQFVYSFLGPIVAGRVVTLHPVAIIFALAVGASLGGFLGAVLAMPVAAAVRTVFIYYHQKHQAQREAELAAPLLDGVAEEA